MAVSWSTVILWDEMAIHYVSTGFIRGYKLDWSAHAHIWTSSSMFESMWMWTLLKHLVYRLTPSLSWYTEVYPCIQKKINVISSLSLSLSLWQGWKIKIQYMQTPPPPIRSIWHSLWKTPNMHTNCIGVKRTVAGLQLVLSEKRKSCLFCCSDNLQCVHTYTQHHTTFITGIHSLPHPSYLVSRDTVP